MHLFFRQYGSGPPLIILHGFLGASGNWHSLAGDSFGKHFSVFVLDLRNHGESPHSDAFDYPSMVADVEQFCNDHGLDEVDIIGHSMGGKIGMHLAIDRPGRVRRLVPVDIAPRKMVPGHLEVFLALRRLDLKRIRSRRDADRELALDIPSPTLREFLLKNLRFTGEGRYVWKANLPVLASSYMNVLAAVPNGVYGGPVLFVKGDRSNYLQATDWPEISRRFPAARMSVIRNAGHWVHADQPQAFADIVLKFLRSERY